MSAKDEDRRLDVTGLKCPLPVIKAQKALRSMTPGEILTVHATDPVSIVDFPHFCNESGHELVGTDRSKEILIFRIKKTA